MSAVYEPFLSATTTWAKCKPADWDQAAPAATMQVCNARIQLIYHNVHILVSGLKRGKKNKKRLPYYLVVARGATGRVPGRTAYREVIKPAVAALQGRTRYN